MRFEVAYDPASAVKEHHHGEGTGRGFGKTVQPDGDVMASGRRDDVMCADSATSTGRLRVEGRVLEVPRPRQGSRGMRLGNRRADIAH